MVGMNQSSTLTPLDCVYRTQIQGQSDAESAQCLLLSQILGTPPEQCEVTRSMCSMCIEQTRQSAFIEHPIFPSLVYHQATEHLARVTDTTVKQRWEFWLTRAENALLKQAQPPSVAPAHALVCDVILCADQDCPQLRAVIESVLSQSGAVPILHLIETGHDPIDWGDLVALWNVQIHRLDGPVTALSAATQVSRWLRTPYLAVQSPKEISTPRRLAFSIQALRDTGAELFVAHVPDHIPLGEDEIPPLIPESLVIRRATLVDMGGAENQRGETEAVCISEAYRQGRYVVTLPDPVLGGEVAKPTQFKPVRNTPGVLRGLIRTAAPSPLDLKLGPEDRFPRVPVRCDVVLPFRGHLDYVREALEGLLTQELATPIIHLIDDVSPEDTTDFLDEWAAHPQLRVYRNRENIGQFQSFNNVAPYWETDLVAVQDADDISLPHRLYRAGQMLHWSGADYFGGAVELFGDDELIRPVMSETMQLKRMRRADYRRSFYPQWAKADYFLENPTAVFRTAMFREMGGYADFGSRLMNRTSLDTEFQLRCLFRGVRFAITREVVTRYRVHPESATQDRLTGWGTTPRASSIRQLEERCRLFRGGDFDPRSFGAIGRYTHLTERWDRGSSSLSESLLELPPN